MKTSTKRPASEVPRNYIELVRWFPLRPIHDRVDYENALEVVNALAAISSLTVDQADYLRVLVSQIKEYERARFGEIAQANPVSILEFLMEQHAMSASGLGRLLGNRSLGSKILRGERALSLEHIRKLCRHFHVGADLFVTPAASR